MVPLVVYYTVSHYSLAASRHSVHQQELVAGSNGYVNVSDDFPLGCYC